MSTLTSTQGNGSRIWTFSRNQWFDDHINVFHLHQFMYFIHKYDNVSSSSTRIHNLAIFQKGPVKLARWDTKPVVCHQAIMFSQFHHHNKSDKGSQANKHPFLWNTNTPCCLPVILWMTFNWVPCLSRRPDSRLLFVTVYDTAEIDAIATDAIHICQTA